MSLFQRRKNIAFLKGARTPILSFILVIGVLMGSVTITAQPQILGDGFDPQGAIPGYSTGWDDNPGDADGKFTIIIIPDTQAETTTAAAIQNKHFLNRMQWIDANKTSRDIRFVIHTGDVVNWDTEDHIQYQIASEAYVPMDSSGIPFSIALGNHDTAAVYNGGSAYEPGNTRVRVRNTSTFNSYFPTIRFPDILTFEPDKVDNSYQTFRACGRKWLVLTLELWPRTEVINWAKTVVEEHPDYNVIVSTHSYLTSGGSIQQDNGGYGSNSPQYLYDNLIKQYANIRFVFSGHTGTAARREDTGVHGNKIVSILGCFHSQTQNPTQILEINVAAGSANSKYYSPVDGYYWSSHERNFTNLSFVSPVSEKARLADLIQLVQLLNSDDYTPASWNTLSQALNAGIAVRNNSQATQQQISSAITSLDFARRDLVVNPPAMGYAWEFNEDGNTQGWSNTMKIINYGVANGCLNGEAYSTGDPIDARIQSPVNLKLDPAFCILRYRARVTNPNFNSFTGGAAYFNRTSDGSAISGSRTVHFPPGMTVQGNVGFVEYAIDLSTHASWNGEIYCLWIDPIRGPNGTTVEIDYIRLYKKGSYALSYNANAGGDTVTKMPPNDTNASNVTGYMLSGQVPQRSGYAFLGWSETPGGKVVDKISIGGNKTVYAKWAPADMAGFAAEFVSANEANLWIGTPQVKVVENGVLRLELQKKDSRIQYVFTTGSDGKTPLSSDYCLMRIRYKKPVAAETGVIRWQRLGDSPGSNDVVTAAQAGRQYSYYFTSSAASNNWYEKTFDLSILPTWNGDIRTIWLDPCEKNDATPANPGKIEYDYIRFYRKGTNTITYHKNTTGTVTNMPDNDAQASVGLNYLLSGQIPARSGYTFAGWSLTSDGSVVSGNKIDVSGNTTVYAKWIPDNSVTASFNAGGGSGTVPANITVAAGSSITLPTAGGLTKAGFLFTGWSDGGAIYQPGDSLTLTANKTFTALWGLPIMGKAYEFNTSGSTDGWEATQKITSFAQAGGCLAITAGVNEPYYDSRINTPSELQLDTAFSILKYRAKINGTPLRNGSVYFTRISDDVNSDGIYGITENGVRNVDYVLQGGNVFVEYTIDLSAHESWDSTVARIWMDPIRTPEGATVDIDYIRLYRKGTNTLVYHANAGGGTVTNMPANDSQAASGAGYLLSGQIPVRSGYTFQGWSITPGGAVISSNSINITGATTTVYAKWTQ